MSVGEPRTVRLIYFLPHERQSKPDIDTQMDTLIKEVQRSYADDMERHGFGRKTFKFETDVTGKAVVHHVDGQFTAEYYEHGTFSKVLGEIEEQFDTQKNIYLVVVDSGYLIGGFPGQATLGIGAGGVAIINNIGHLATYVYLASHELRHVFGLTHDFRIDDRGFTFEISKCTAEFLDVHRYFNASRQGQNFLRNTMIEMLPPNLASAPNAIRLRFEVTDADGVHQARLLTSERRLPVVTFTGGFIACKQLNGISSTVEFVTTVLTPKDNIVSLQLIDVHGNITTSRPFPIDVTSLLLPPEVVSIPDVNLAMAVRETLGLSPGVVLTSHTTLELKYLEAGNRQITDLTGLEHATNLIELVLFNNNISDISAVAGLTNLKYLDLTGNSISDISAVVGLTNLIHLYLVSNNISDVSVVAGLTNLETLDLGGNRLSDLSVLAGLTNLNWLFFNAPNISDVSVVAGLTNLTWLSMNLGGNYLSDLSVLADLTSLKRLDFYNGNVSDISAVAGLANLKSLYISETNVSDISAVAGLTNLESLYINNTNISDISPLVENTGLGSGDTVDVQGNPLSYQSIHTHIPILRQRGVTVHFRDQAHPALLKISGNNQKGAAFASLSQPFVVEAQDENGSALAGISVTFTVTRGGGVLSTTITRTDENGRAQSTLTLGPNLGTNTVSVSAADIESPATFYAISDAESPPIEADVNNDGSVNILDLILIASDLGNAGTNLAADVSGDGVVNILDLVLAAGMFDGAAAAPSAHAQVPETLTAVEVQGWLTDARALEVRDPIMKRGFMVLEQLLVSLTPRETELLANYPNPFNPETWIPYRLAEDDFVTLTIYDLSGQVVRTLDVGHRIAAVYESRSKAVYWDGRNDIGESVASGVYFYTLETNNFTATRKLLILK